MLAASVAVEALPAKLVPVAAVNEPVTSRLLISLLPPIVALLPVIAVGKAPLPPWNNVAVMTLTFVLPLLSLATIEEPLVQLVSLVVLPSSKSAFKFTHLALDDVLIGGTVVAVDSNWKLQHYWRRNCFRI